MSCFRSGSRPTKSGLLRIDETAKPSFDERVLRREVAPERRVALLHAQGLDGAAADQGEALGLAARKERLEEMVLVGERVMQLPAELAHIIHAQRQDVGRKADRDAARRPPGEGRIRKIGVAEARQEVAGSRPDDGESAEGRGDVSQAHARRPWAEPWRAHRSDAARRPSGPPDRSDPPQGASR